MNKKFRLKKTFEIEKLFKKRISVGNAYFVMYYNLSSNESTRVAISVSKKLGNAVIRNREKRIIREIIRGKLDTIKGLDILIVEKSKSLNLTFEEKMNEISILIKKMIRKGV